MPPVRPGPCTEAGLTHTSSMLWRSASRTAARSASYFERSYSDRNQPRCGVSSVATTPAASPTAAADDVYTIRPAPARAHAPTTFTVPVTFAALIGPGSRMQKPFIPAAW